MDKAEIVREIKNLLWFKESNPNICANCVYSVDTKDHKLECNYNPLFPFGVEPHNTCRVVKRSMEHIEL